MRPHEYLPLITAAFLLLVCAWYLGRRRWRDAGWSLYFAVLAALLPIEIDALLILAAMGAL